MQPDTAPTLKPCPLCGTSDGVTIGPSRAGGLHWHNIECHACCLYITGNTEAEAIAAWNTRASQPTACTECERLAEALEDIAEHETDCPSMTATEAMEHTLSEIRDKARFALASHTVRLIDGEAGK